MNPDDEQNTALETFLAQHEVPERFRSLFSKKQLGAEQQKALQEVTRLQEYEKDDARISSALLTAMNEQIGLEDLKRLLASATTIRTLKKREVDNTIAVAAIQLETDAHDYQMAPNLALGEVQKQAAESLKVAIAQAYDTLPATSQIRTKAYEGLTCHSHARAQSPR